MQWRGWCRDDGFSLVEVMLAVVILGVTGLAFVDGLQSNVLQVRRVDATASSAVVLASAVENIKAAPYVSCKDSATPYNTLPSGLSLPSGLTIAVQEFVPGTSEPWQPCQTVRTSGIGGAAQSILLTAADGGTRTMMRFAAGTTSVPVSTNPTPLTASVVTDGTTNSKSSCNSFGGSSSSKLCTITVTRLTGSGSNWRINGITFIPGVDFFYPSTTPVPQSTQIVFSTYIQSGSNQCADNKYHDMVISLVDEGNSTTTSVTAALKC